MVGLPDSEKMRIYTRFDKIENVTDSRTDRQADRHRTTA